MRIANKDAGEVEIVLDGATWVLRPDFTACIAIERNTGNTMLELAQRMNDGRSLPLETVAHIVTAAVHSWGVQNKDDVAKAVNHRRIAELLFAGGVKCWAVPVLEFLLASVNPERPGNADPTAGAAAS